jgi:hypothetical protein
MLRCSDPKHNDILQMTLCITIKTKWYSFMLSVAIKSIIMSVRTICQGATTLSIMTLGKMTLAIIIENLTLAITSAECYYIDCHALSNI